MIKTAAVLTKILTPNDVGLTGAHQDGVHVPKNREALAFFPELDPAELNPRVQIAFTDIDSGEALQLSFIYYNGKLIGASTRNEYRLTPLSAYFRSKDAETGDRVEFSKSANDEYFIRIIRKRTADQAESDRDPGVVYLSGTWNSRRYGAMR